jgi:hypothetical protein
VKVHTVQLTKLPHPHSRGVHRLLGFMATIATAGLSSLSQITYPARSSARSTAALPGGFVCLPTSPKFPRSITRPLLIGYANTILYVYLCLAFPPADLLRNHFKHILLMPILTRTRPDDAHVDPNSSEGVDPSCSEGVDPSCSKGFDTSSSKRVDMMLTHTPAKLLSVLVLNVSCRSIVRLP